MRRSLTAVTLLLLCMLALLLVNGCGDDQSDVPSNTPTQVDENEPDENEGGEMETNENEGNENESGENENEGARTSPSIDLDLN
jgi:hypothetical protein